MMQIYDHNGNPVKKGYCRTNGIKMYYLEAGEGEPLLLLHGTPKSNIYWHKVIPLLSKHFRVIAPDLRGFGYSDKPTVAEGYDNLMNVKDIEGLLENLNIDKLYIHGEDRGAEWGWAYAALHPDKVKAISFCEMAISGYGIEEMGYMTEENINAIYKKNGKWLWHVPFHYNIDTAMMLIQGHEREYWTHLIMSCAFDPAAFSAELLDEWAERWVSPGGTRGILETYRAEFVNMRFNKELIEKQGKVHTPCLTIGGCEFYGVTVKDHASKIFDNIEESLVFDDCGHNLALEQPQMLADALVDFMNKH